MFMFLSRFGRLFVGAAIVIAVTSVIGFSALTTVNVASKHKTDPSCSISPNPSAANATYVVSASGLPALSAINLKVTYGNGTVTMSPLGSTPDGTFAMNESSPVTGTTPTSSSV